MKRMLLAASLLALVTGAAIAREPARKAASPANMSGRTGIGFNAQLTNQGITSLSLRHWLSNKTALEGILGFALGDDKVFDLGGKILGVIRSEQNLKFYGFGLIGIENYDIGGVSDTNVKVAGGVGVEFFMPGIPSLGLSTEVGLAYDGGTELFGTFGDWITSAGARYYF